MSAQSAHYFMPSPAVFAVPLTHNAAHPQDSQQQQEAAEVKENEIAERRLNHGTAPL